MSARTLQLSELTARLHAAGLLSGALTTPADVSITGVADDSRRVQAGDLFCAWSGTESDAHAFVPAAERAGAAAALVERRVADVEVPQLTVRNGRRAAALAASLVFGEPEQSLRLAGVTGTNGKTTTVWVLRHMLSQHEPAASLGTLGTILEDGTTLPGSEALTTPGPVDMARTLRLLVDRGVRVLAMEVSSHALEQGRVHALHFDAAVFTNLSRDHLDYHGTLDAYLAAKRTLVTLLREDGCAIVNADDPAWTGLAEQAPRSLSFGMHEGADVTACGLELTADGARFELHTPNGSAPAHFPLLGDFNVQNALGAAAACIALGFSVADAAAALADVPQVPGRLERIASSPCAVLRDYAHTPDALERALMALRPFATARLIVVFGAGGDRDRGKRPLMGAAAVRAADVVIVTSDNPRTEDADAIIDEIETGMAGATCTRITDRREAIAYALHLAAAEDIVLLAGKGHETYQIIGREKQPFDERVIVRELLELAS
ncbi:MAG: UDP-N-acetylmuramoyl-L-alanyl-D-glutamate--2,6-diaminopimelate ligase [Gemmatimonadota bacterium]